VGAISILTFGLVTAGVRLLISAGVATFTKDLGLSSGCMTGIAMLVGAIMTARSPASAIAIVKELRAKGPFTRCFLGVTVVSDVVVLVLFAISVAFTRGQCTGKGFSGGTICAPLPPLLIYFRECTDSCCFSHSGRRFGLLCIRKAYCIFTLFKAEFQSASQMVDIAHWIWYLLSLNILLLADSI
jgi:hypothetical protein